MKLLMQAATIALNGRRYLPIILDYQRNNSGKRVKEITNQILKFYGGAMLGNGVNMNYISDVSGFLAILFFFTLWTDKPILKNFRCTLTDTTQPR